jgi:hypothetical protein
MIRSAIVALAVAAASLFFAMPAAAEDGYEWGGVASPFVNVCVGVETVVPFVPWIGSCTPDLTEEMGDLGVDLGVG